MTPLPEKKLRSIPGSLIYNYYQRWCPYEVKLFLQKEKAPRRDNPLEEYFIHRGVDREEQYFGLLKEEFGEDCVILDSDDSLTFEEDIQRRAVKTKELMALGKKVICHGILSQEEGLSQFSQKIGHQYPDLPFTPLFRGEPDMLFKKEGGRKSHFGVYFYEVGDVKSSYRSKFCQQMQVTYYSFLLEDIQGTLSDEGFIITQEPTRDFGLESFSLKDTRLTLGHLLEEELWEWLLEEDLFFHITSLCKGCDFFQVCTSSAREKGDISLIPGLKRAQKKALRKGKILTLKDLAGAVPGDLKRMNFPGVNTEGLLPLSFQARALLENRPFYRPPKTSPQKAAEELTTYVQLDQAYRAVRHHFDLKSPGKVVFGSLSLDSYLGEGILSLGDGEEVKFYSSFEAFPQGKKLGAFFEDLLVSLEGGEDFILVHYGGSLPQNFRKLIQKLDLSLQNFLQDFLFFQLLDLKKLIQRVLALPVYSFALEEVTIKLEELVPGEKKGLFDLSSALSLVPPPFSAEEVLETSPSLYLRLYWETGDENWLHLLKWREKETLKALEFLFQILSHLEEAFADLSEFSPSIG